MVRVLLCVCLIVFACARLCDVFVCLFMLCCVMVYGLMFFFVLFCVVVFVCVFVICVLMCVVFVRYCAMLYDCCACSVLWVSACVVVVWLMAV